MKRVLFTFCALAGYAALPVNPALAETKQITAVDMIEIFEKLGGKHPGYRKAHANGVCATAVFTPSSSVQTNTYFAGAPLLSNGDLPVSMRFSVGGGDPKSNERTPGTRGAGIMITLPSGGKHVFTGNNFPVFAGKDVETFHGFLTTLLPDENGQRNPQKTAEYIQQHPSLHGHVAWQQNAQAPASYANTEFFGIHTFYYDPANGKRTKFRWHLVPDGGVKNISKEDAATLPNAFLADKLNEQVKQQTVSFTLHASIGAEQDVDIDPSVKWPDDRPKVELGKITLNSAGGDDCTVKNYDPNILSKGFAPSQDPVLQMRSPAYAISFGKRLSNQ